MNVRKVRGFMMAANVLETLIIQTFLNVRVISPQGNQRVYNINDIYMGYQFTLANKLFI